MIRRLIIAVILAWIVLGMVPQPECTDVPTCREPIPMSY